MTPFQQKLQGSIPAMMTALGKDLAVDPEAMRKTAIRLLDNGSRGLVVLGTTGEFAGIDDDQRAVAIRAVVDEVDGRAPTSRPGPPRTWAPTASSSTHHSTTP